MLKAPRNRASLWIGLVFLVVLPLAGWRSQVYFSWDFSLATMVGLPVILLALHLFGLVFVLAGAAAYQPGWATSLQRIQSMLTFIIKLAVITGLALLLSIELLVPSSVPRVWHQTLLAFGALFSNLLAATVWFGALRVLYRRPKYFSVFFLSLVGLGFILPSTGLWASLAEKMEHQYAEVQVAKAKSPDALVELLLDENPYVRGASRRAVWKRWNSYKQTMDLPGHLAPRLLDVFQMEDTAAYHLAAVAVRGMDVDPKQVVPLLVSLSRREDPELQAEVLESMRKLKQLPEVSIPAFRARLVDSDDAVRVQACLGLAVFREVAREAMNCLQTMLDSPGREDRRRAIKAIRRLQLPAGEKLPLYRRLVVGKDDVLRYHTVLGLFDLGPEAVPAIRELRLSYDMEGTPWMWVIAALTRVDTPESRAALNSIPEEKRQEARRRIAPAYWRKDWVGFHKTDE